MPCPCAVPARRARGVHSRDDRCRCRCDDHASAAGAAAAGRNCSRGTGGSGFSAQDPLNALAQWSLGYDSRNSALMRDAFTTDAEFI
jgi:hypothetical protein